MNNEPKNERESWEIIHGPDRRAVCKYAREFFKGMFPRGHKTSLRDNIELCTDKDVRAKFKKGTYSERLVSFHPRAFLLLLEYGQDYTPIPFKEPPDYLGEPTWGRCHKNSQWLMTGFNSSNRQSSQDETSENMVYVEGLVFGSLCLPMLHAWNSRGLKSKKAFDWTCYASTHWNRYFGIPFTEEEYRELTLQFHPDGKRIPLFLEDCNFEKIEHYLHELLARRKETQMQEKLWGA